MIKRFLFLALLLPLALLSQNTITKVVNGGPGVGNFNLMVTTPPGVTGDTVGLIFFPGSGESGSDASKAFVNGPDYWIKATPTWKPGMIIAFAQTPVTWGPNPGARPLFVLAVLKELLNGGYHIDKKRFTLTGLSWGAAYIFNYMQFAADSEYIRPAAVVAMSMGVYGLAGNYNANTDALSGTDSRWGNVPAWFFCGSSDGFLQPMLRYVSLQKAAGVIIKMTQFTGGHCCWSGPYSPSNPTPIYPWILSQAANPPVVIPPPVVTPPAPRTVTDIHVNINGMSIALPLAGSTITYSDGKTETITKP